jgi:hypothetical protein
MAFTQFLMKAAQSRVEADSLQLEAARISEFAAKTDDPALTDCVGFLGSYLSHAKRSILELSELQRRSIVYSTLTPIRPNYSWGTVAQLENAQLNFNEAWIKSLDQREAR